MAQSLSKLYVHIVFSTKNRENYLKASIREELFHYFGGILNNLSCTPIKINGISDHVHILCVQSKNIAASKLLEEIKKGTSKWIKTKGDFYSNFKWQAGYSIFQ